MDDDKKQKHMSPVLFMILFIVGSYVLFYLFNIFAAVMPSRMTYSEHKTAVRNLINNTYPNYEIETINLQYSDWSSTVRAADGDHTPESAEVVIEKGEDKLYIYCTQTLDIWHIKEAIPMSGSQVPNGVYFGEFEITNIGSAVNIEEHIKERNYWVIPDENGNDYHKSGGTDWYYSLKKCNKIYKTIDGKVYFFNKDTNTWDLSVIPYSDLVHYGNYTEITKEEAQQILSKYASYTEE